MDPNIRVSGQTSKPSDVYSFGILMVELYTGKHPFIHNRDGSFAQNKDFFDLSSVPEEYAALASQCLHQDPKARPTYNQLVSILTQYVESLLLIQV